MQCADDEKENLDVKGKAPMRAEDLAAAAAADGAGVGDEGDDDEDEDEDAEEGGEGDGEGGGVEEEDDDGGDMQLAWEMLEVARAIYAKSGAAHATELAGAPNPGPWAGPTRHFWQCGCIVYDAGHRSRRPWVPSPACKSLASPQ